MPRLPSQSLLLALTLLALLVLSPTLATAQPRAQHATLSAAEPRETSPGLLPKLWALISTLWLTRSSTEPEGAATGDTGSILEPNG